MTYWVRSASLDIGFDFEAERPNIAPRVRSRSPERLPFQERPAGPGEQTLKGDQAAQRFLQRLIDDRGLRAQLRTGTS